MSSSEIAGVIPKGNWNNASGAASSTALSLINEQGLASGASVTWRADNAWYLPITDVAGNNRMMRGYLDNVSGLASTIRFAGLVPGNYNIYVYTDGDNGASTRSGIYQISGSGIPTTSIRTTDAANTNFTGAFLRASNSTGNYILFSAVPISSELTLTATPGTTTDYARAAVNAIQIVPSAAPVSTALNVNFVGQSTTALGASEMAGVVADVNWNNLSGSASSSPVSLVNDKGQASGASVTWTADNVWNLPTADVAGNSRMIRGYLDTGYGNPSTVIFSGLVPGTYDIYVYADGDNGGTRTGIYRISGPGLTTTSISATDTANTNFNGTFVRANNSNGNYVVFAGVTISSAFTLTATPGAATDAPRAPVNALQIVPSTQPPPISGSTVAVSITPMSTTLSAAQAQQFTATVSGNQNTAVTWSVSPAIGSISTAGLYKAPSTLTTSQTITVTATSVADPTKSASAGVLLNAPAAPPMTITTSALPNGTVNALYSASVAATGGVGPYTWTVMSGSLPPGVTLTGSTGLISGTTSQAGSYFLIIGVTDSVGNQATRSYAMSMLAVAPSYYVSTISGNDSWSGLLASPNSSNTDGPFKTLGKAQSAMQGSSLKTVYLRAGTYTLTANLQLGYTDNGETWQNYLGEAPIIDGNNNSFRILLSNVNNLKLWGLTFQNLAGGCTGTCGTVGAISGSFSNLVFEYNTFNNCTNSCLMGQNVQYATVSNNRFNNLAPGIGPVGDNFAVWFFYGSSNNNISHNSFQNLQGGAVFFGSGPNDPPTNNNVVDRNYLNSIDTNVFTDGFGDIGALYIDDMTHKGTGNQFTNNVILNNCGPTYTSELCKAIYLDDETSNVMVSGNICQHCGAFAFQIHGGDHNTFQNNIFDLSSAGTQLALYQLDGGNPDYGMANNVFTKNLIYTSGSATGIKLWNNQKSASDANPTVMDNLYYAAGGGTWMNSNPADTAPVYQNPQFANPSGSNFTMAATSPAYTTVGFAPLPADQGPLPNTSATSGGGVLTGIVDSSSRAVSLTAEGSTDWVHWSNGALVRKAATAQISSYSIVGSGTAQPYSNDPRPVSWNDGTTTASGSDQNGVDIGPAPNGFSFTAPAGTSTHILVIHVGGWASGGTLTAHLSDASAPDFVDKTPVSSAQFDRNYTLNYTAASAGQTINVSWVQNGGTTGSVTLSAVALQ